MDKETLQKINQSLVSEVEKIVWRNYHQTLSEVLNDLSVHRFSYVTSPAGNDALRVVSKSGVLDALTDERSRTVVETLRRLEKGTFGRCLRCVKELSASLLEQEPTARYCLACTQKQGQPAANTVVHPSMNLLAL